MKKTHIAMIGTGVILVGIGWWGLPWYVSEHNRLVPLNEKVQGAGSQVQNVLDRQFQLLPNLAATVESYAGHEKSTFTEVAAARTDIQGVSKVDPTKIGDKDTQDKIVKAQEEIGHLVSKINATAEAYPELKANDHYKEMMTELEGSINRVSQERRKYQIVVTQYNSEINLFPTQIVGWIDRNLAAKPYFAAREEEQNAPKVFQH